MLFVKLWGKIYIDNKIVNQHVIDISKSYMQNLTQHLSDVCNELDIATPVLSNKHLEDLETYNTAIFLESDFIEVINFEKFVIEVF